MNKRNILVVGDATGIGRATAMLSAQHGAYIIVADANVSDGNATAIASSGIFIDVDVRNEIAVKAMSESIGRSHIRLDGLVQASSILKGAYDSIEDLDIKVILQVLEVNTVGSFLYAKYATPLLNIGYLPVIVNVSSGAAHGVSSSYAYGASKGGVSALGITIAGKLAPEGIRVNVVCPGGINTAMKLSVIAEDARRNGQDPEVATTVASHSLGDPIGVAKLLSFLLSEEADYVRGSISTR